MNSFAESSGIDHEAFLEAYRLPEKEVWKLDDSEVSQAPYSGAQRHPESFKDGLKLGRAVLMVYSADSPTDYKNDVQRYDQTAQNLNTKYGKIVRTSDEVTNPAGDFGLVEEPKNFYDNVTVTTTVLTSSNKDSK